MKENREIYRFRKNSKEEIVISLCRICNIDYLSIARYYDDGDGEGYFRRNSICIQHILIDDLLTGLQLAVRALGDGTRLFLSRHGVEHTH